MKRLKVLCLLILGFLLILSCSVEKKKEELPDTAVDSVSENIQKGDKVFLIPFADKGDHLLVLFLFDTGPMDQEFILPDLLDSFVSTQMKKVYHTVIFSAYPQTYFKKHKLEKRFHEFYHFSNQSELDEAVKLFQDSEDSKNSSYKSVIWGLLANGVISHTADGKLDGSIYLDFAGILESDAKTLKWSWLKEKYFQPFLTKGQEFIGLLGFPYSHYFLDESTPFLSGKNYLLLGLKEPSFRSHFNQDNNNTNESALVVRQLESWFDNSNSNNNSEQLQSPMNGFGTIYLWQGFVEALKGYALDDKKGYFQFPDLTVSYFDHQELVTTNEVIDYLQLFLKYIPMNYQYRYQHSLCQEEGDSLFAGVLDNEVYKQMSGQEWLKNPLLWYWLYGWDLGTVRSMDKNFSLSNAYNLPLTFAHSSIISLGEVVAPASSELLYTDDLKPLSMRQLKKSFSYVRSLLDYHQNPANLSSFLDCRLTDILTQDQIKRKREAVID